MVRSERRFESIEVDRSENMIEKLSDIDGIVLSFEKIIDLTFN